MPENKDINENDKKNKAVALKYNPEADNAPKVLAKGQGFIAEKILKLAEENNILVKQDENLVKILDAVEINAEIPVAAFTAVAEILAFVYKQNNKMQELK